MTIAEIIEFVDALKPNPYSDAQKTAWLSRCEGQIQTECYLMPAEYVLVYDYDEDSELNLLVPPPYDKLYESYLSAMIDYANGEYNKYSNTMEMFNRDMSDFTRWLTGRYEPTKRFLHNEELGSITYNAAGPVLLDTLPEDSYLYFVSCEVTAAFNSGTSDTITLKDADGSVLITADGHKPGVTRKSVKLFGANKLYAEVTAVGTPSSAGSAVFCIHSFRQDSGSVTIGKILDAVDVFKPNAYTDERKVAWLSQCEGQIQTECYLMSAEDVLVYKYDRDSGIFPLVPLPYDKVYESYISAMIDYHRGDYDKYKVGIQMYNNDLSALTRWLTRVYEPTQCAVHNKELGTILFDSVAVLLDTLPNGAYLYFVTCNVTEVFNSSVSDTITLRDEDGNTLLSIDGQNPGITRRAVRVFGAKGLYAQSASEGNPSTEGSATFYAHYFRENPNCGRQR